ncbi:MAG: 2 protein [Candidatus Poribacteria bacterium]|nr:2 protein [Candidatus Poribacteria bacterium]
MVLNSILFSFILFLISFVLGRRILVLLFFRYSAERESKITFSSLLEEFVFSTGVGLGIVSYLTLALGLLGLIYKWVYLLFLGILICFTLYEIWKSKKFLHISWQKLRTSFSTKPKTYFGYSLLIIPSIYIVLSLLNALAPPSDFDSLMYHLAIPKIWIQNHRIIYIPYIFQSEYHLTIETLYTLGMVLTNDISACLVIWMLSILFLLTIFSFCQRYFSIKVGILASGALCCTPLYSAISTRSMVDIPVGYFAFLGLYALFMYMEKNDYKTLTLIGITTGLAVAIKHTGLVITALLFITIIILNIKRNGFRMVSFKHVILFGIIILLISAPWYIKSFINTGKFITSSVDVSSAAGISGNQGIIANFTILNILEKIQKIVINFLRFISIDMLFHRSLSKTLWGVGPFILAFVPLALVKGMDKTIKLILIYSISGLFLFSILSHQHHVRFALPMFASLSVIGAYSVFGLLEKYKPLVRFIQIIILAIFLLNIIPLAKYTLNALPVVIGSETKEHYLNRVIRLYDVVEYANNNIGNDVKILSMDLRVYYFDKPYATIYTIIDVYKSKPDLLQRLRTENITHLLCNENYSNTGYYSIPEDLRSYIQLKYTNNNTYLYKLDW